MFVFNHHGSTIWSLNDTQMGFVLPILKYNRYLYEILSIEVHSTVVRRWGSTKPIWVVPAHFYCRPHGFFVPHLLRRRFFFRFGLVIKSVRAFLEGGGAIFFHSFSTAILELFVQIIGLNLAFLVRIGTGWTFISQKLFFSVLNYFRVAVKVS